MGPGAARRGAWGLGPPAPQWATAAAMGPGAAFTAMGHRRRRRGARGGGGGDKLGWGQAQILLNRQSLSILDKSSN